MIWEERCGPDEYDTWEEREALKPLHDLIRKAFEHGYDLEATAFLVAIVNAPEGEELGPEEEAIKLIMDRFIITYSIKEEAERKRLSRDDKIRKVARLLESWMHDPKWTPADRAEAFKVRQQLDTPSGGWDDPDLAPGDKDECQN